LGDYKLNVTTFWIDMFAKIGWAWDLKEPSKELLRKTIEKHGKTNDSNKTNLFVNCSHLFAGDGSHPVFGHGSHENHSPVESIAAPGEPNLGY
jgi:hypothetical protein